MRQERDDQVVILAAGLGTGMGENHYFAPRAILPLWGKPVLAWILEQIPKSSEILIAVGFEAQDIKDLVHASFQDWNITFVPVDHFAGQGSGRGYSLLSCRPFLKGPFTLVCDHAIWNGVIPLSLSRENWVGKPAGISTTSEVFTGLAHIEDHELFLDGIQNGEAELASGFQALIRQGSLRVREIHSWIDISTEEKYLDACEQREDLSFRKYGEFFYIVNGRVVKYFKDQRTAHNRFTRALQLGPLAPEDVQIRGRFLSYPFIPGHTLYSELNEHNVRHLLKTLDEQLWRPVSVSSGSFREICGDFYRNRLFSRAKDVAEKASFLLGNIRFSGGRAGNVTELLNGIDWSGISNGWACQIHGDLQADNILIQDENFKLIDWRQDFGGQLVVGDIYYDLAKLHASLGVDFSQLKAGAFGVKIETNGQTAMADLTQVPTPGNSVNLQMQVLAFARKKGLDPKKVETLSALIILYIAPHHTRKFMLWSWCYGVRKLFELNDSSAKERPVRSVAATYDAKSSAL